MKKLLLVFLLLSQIAYSQTTSIIPQPVSVKPGTGIFTISKKTVLLARDEEDKKTAGLFNDYLQQVYGFRLDVDKQEKKNSIRFNTKKFIRAPDKDAYSLTVTKEGITIDGDTYPGTFYGMQSLIQLLPADNYKQTTANFKFDIPVVVIQDYPRFNYRGMHLDVCRHFFPVSFVKKYIDYLALHKMDYFHWHLTDDQGWRIEIKKYPGLTTTGAYRNGTIIGRYPGTGNDNIRYGGFYTQEEVKEVVAYAAGRYITVIPEIEMPGHSSAAIASYPWLSCFPNEETKIPTHPSEASKQTGGKKVQETWGVFEDVFCAGKDSTFLFLQDVLDEVMPLFPSTYIHLGGDESPKANWKRCPNCQARMQALGLKTEHELQSYFVQRMEKFVNSKGKTIIGWDEILEGGLAPNAVVMSWRGEKGGIDAATQNHSVIMTPQKPVYFDHTQTKNEDSLVIGGYNPLEAVYAYEPWPKELDSSKAKFILGAQANLWTEYIANERKVEYMVFPRMSALSEVLWSPKEKRNWSDFEKRLQVQFKRYDLWKANYSKAYFDLKTTILPNKNNSGLIWKVQRRNKNGSIKIDDNGAIEFKDRDSLEYVIRKGGTYEIALAKITRTVDSKNKKRTITTYNNISSPIVQKFYFNKATGKNVSITKAPNEKYPGQGGAFSLVNGVYSNKGLSYPDWLGWIGDDMEALIDLGKKQNFDSVRMHTLEQNGSWIYLPQYVEVQTSDDGKNFISAGRSSQFITDTLTMGWITVAVPKTSSRYIKVIAKNYGLIPDGKPGGGNRAWLFSDEIQVY
jgi:hexosaminidase